MVHLIYYQGDPQNGDLFYVRSADLGASFTSPLRVNSRAASAMAVGNIRGAHLALGKNGRVHVGWMGSNKAEPRGPSNAAPMLYARMNDAGDGFEPERNLIQSAPGLDGGASVAADEFGNIYATWHAPQPGKSGEANRRVWVARSKDDGLTFAPETIASGPEGVCGCCGMRAFADRQGAVYLLYRSAAEQVHRDAYLQLSRDRGKDFQVEKVHAWTVNTCPMSSFVMTEGGSGALAAWETAGQIYWARIDPVSGKRSEPTGPTGASKGRKYPAIATNNRGEVLLVWTEGTGWNRGGSVAWQLFDAKGVPTGVPGLAEGVPVWSLVAVFSRPDGGFTIVY